MSPPPCEHEQEAVEENRTEVKQERKEKKRRKKCDCCQNKNAYHFVVVEVEVAVGTVNMVGVSLGGKHLPGKQKLRVVVIAAGAAQVNREVDSTSLIVVRFSFRQLKK